MLQNADMFSSAQRKEKGRNKELEIQMETIFRKRQILKNDKEHFLE